MKLVTDCFAKTANRPGQPDLVGDDIGRRTAVDRSDGDDSRFNRVDAAGANALNRVDDLRLHINRVKTFVGRCPVTAFAQYQTVKIINSGSDITTTDFDLPGRRTAVYMQGDHRVQSFQRMIINHASRTAFAF